LIRGELAELVRHFPRRVGQPPKGESVLKGQKKRASGEHGEELGAGGLRLGHGRIQNAGHLSKTAVLASAEGKWNGKCGVLEGEIPSRWVWLPQACA
jgi:hypothetical protein